MNEYIYEIHKTYEIVSNSIFLPKDSLPKIYTVLTFVCDTDTDDDETANIYADDNDMHIAIALTQLC